MLSSQANPPPEQKRLLRPPHAPVGHRSATIAGAWRSSGDAPQRRAVRSTLRTASRSRGPRTDPRRIPDRPAACPALGGRVWQPAVSQCARRVTRADGRDLVRSWQERRRIRPTCCREPTCVPPRDQLAAALAGPPAGSGASSVRSAAGNCRPAPSRCSRGTPGALPTGSAPNRHAPLRFRRGCGTGISERAALHRGGLHQGCGVVAHPPDESSASCGQPPSDSPSRDSDDRP